MCNSSAFRSILEVAPSPTGNDAWYTLGLEPHIFEGSLHSIVNNLFEDVLCRTIAEGGVNRRILNSLARSLLLEHLVEGSNLDPAFETYENVFARVSTSWEGIVPLSDTGAWVRAVEITRAAKVVMPGWDFKSSDDQRQMLYQRFYAVGKAAARLKSFGIDIRVENGELILDDLDHAGEYLAECCNKLGGVQVAKMLFEQLTPHYDQTQKRYHHVRVAPMVPKERGSLIPAGYLLNLAAKTAGSPPYAGSDWRELARAVLSLAADMVAVLDVEPYSLYEGINQSHDSIIRYLQEIAIFDHAIALRQLRPTDVSRLLRGLFGWVSDDLARKHLGWTIGEATQVLGSLFEEACLHRGPFEFTEDEATRLAHGVDRQVVHAILAVSTHNSQINNGYLMPTDSTKADFGFRPFLRTGKGYLILDASASAYAAYEAVAGALREARHGGVGVFKNSQEKIGIAAERFLHEELRNHGINALEGEYLFPVSGAQDEEGECDAVIETADQITFIESKLKALKRSSSGGDDFAMIIDLGLSLFAAQLQAGNHERRLIEAGKIEFKDGTILERKGRHIERIAVTLLDYGGYQDRLVLHHTMNLLRGRGLTLNRPESKSERKDRLKLEETLREVHVQVERLSELEPARRDEYFKFMNCWFLSIPQLLVLLDGVRSGEDFNANLSRLRHVTTGMLDFYCEFAALERREGPQADNTHDI